MARGTISVGKLRTEQIKLQPRTSDPSGTVEGEAWLRSDVAPETDQLATVRVDVGGSTVDVPVFTTGTSGSNVSEARRVRVNGATGFIPIAALSESPTFEQFRIAHNSDTYGWHNALSAFDGPDSVDYYATIFDADESDGETIDRIPAQVGANDLIAYGDPIYDANGINTNPAADCDGNGDYFAVDNSSPSDWNSFHNSTTVSYMMVVLPRSENDDRIISTLEEGVENNGLYHNQDSSGDTIQAVVVASGSTTASSTSADATLNSPHIYRFDDAGGSLDVIVDGTTILSGMTYSTSSGDADTVLHLMKRKNDTLLLDGNLGAFARLTNPDTGDADEMEQQLADDFNITI